MELGQSGKTSRSSVRFNPKRCPSALIHPPVDTLIYTAFGIQDGNTVTDDEERKHLSGFIYNKLPGLVKEGKIKPNVITKWEGGLDRVPDAIEYLAAGKVSGEKIVFSL